MVLLSPRVTVSREWYQMTDATMQKMNDDPDTRQRWLEWLTCPPEMTPAWEDEPTIRLHAPDNDLMGLEALDLWHDTLKEASELSSRSDIPTPLTPLVIRQLCTIARHAGANVALAILERHLFAEVPTLDSP